MNNLQEAKANQAHVEQVPFGTVQHNLSDILPMSSEIGHLWSSYLAESMAVAMLKYYVAQSKDPDIRPILQRSLDVSSQRVKSMKDIFNSIQHPIPEGFGENDVDSNAKQLFEETYTLKLTRMMNKYVLLDYGIALCRSSRSDFRSYFSEGLDTSREIHQKATDVLLAKGLLLKYPSIVNPDRIDRVHDKGYFGTIFGTRRPINAMEISNIISLMEVQLLLRTSKIGFSQVVKSEKIRHFLSQGKQIADHHLKTLGEFLENEELPIPSISSNLITDSKQSPFSDKLILTHSTISIAFKIAEYGLVLTNTARKDLQFTFRNLVTDVLKLAKDGAELMIESGWLERAPEASDRKELIH